MNLFKNQFYQDILDIQSNNSEKNATQNNDIAIDIITTKTQNNKFHNANNHNNILNNNINNYKNNNLSNSHINNLKINKSNLSEILRPQNFTDLIGLEENLSQITILQSMIFWGPPGTGKTSLAKILIRMCGIKNFYMSAVVNNTQQFREIFELSEFEKIFLVIDEIHHLNKSQQDIFLPYIESGRIILIGITTENPSFELRPALLSRCKILIFNRLSMVELTKIMAKAEVFFQKKLPLNDEAKNYLCELADGDARFLLNRVEELFYLNYEEFNWYKKDSEKKNDKKCYSESENNECDNSDDDKINFENSDKKNNDNINKNDHDCDRFENQTYNDKNQNEKFNNKNEKNKNNDNENDKNQNNAKINNIKTSKYEINLEQLLAILKTKKSINLDKDSHYSLISALHKSIRGSDVQAALYWFSRMIVGNDDPIYIARRLIRMSVEDIGMADPNALLQAVATLQAYQTLGSPEGELCLAQCVIYLATAPKSNAGYIAYKKAIDFAKKNGNLAPPKHLINAPTQMMKNLDFAKYYVYDPDTPHSFSGQEYFPENVVRCEFYKPREFGFEKEVEKRLQWWAKLKAEKKR